jgi:hypothetical protein
MLASFFCAAQTCPQDQPKGVNPPVLASEGHGVCRYDRPQPKSQPSYWWQLLADLFSWQPKNQPPFRRSVAFLAGVSKYDHISPQLDFVRNDLAELRNFLLTGGGFDTVYEVRDANVTRETFDDYMKKHFSNPRGPAGPEDRLLVYFSGHGGAQADSEPYLLFQKAQPNDYTANVLDVRDVFSWANTIQAKHLLVILDSCFSGLAVPQPGPSDVAAAVANALAGEPSAMLLTAGTGDEEAYAIQHSKERNGSIFTHAILDALNDISLSEGIVTIGQAFETAKLFVAGFNAVNNRKMNPSATKLVRNNKIGKGNFIFINTRAQNPSLPPGLYGQATLIAKAPETVDPSLQLIQLEYEEVKTSNNLTALRAFVSTYRGKPYGQTLVGLIEERIDNLDPKPGPDRLNHAGEVKVNPKDGLDYRWIPPGTFMMGCSPGDQECNDDEKPPKRVTISKGFWLGESEVTQAAYQKVTGQNPSHFKGADLPVESVTWDEACAYCRAVGGRLPKEAEWEYAARAGTTGARYGELDRVAWDTYNSGYQTHPVKQKEPNAWGLFDMLGNVWEWVEDLYPETQERTLRGGSWYKYSRGLRESARTRNEPSWRLPANGFRCAWE